MADSPRRIALWGYGRYGKRLYEAIDKNWSDYYVVVEVFDKGVDENENTMLEGGVPLLNPDKALSEYEAGRFEALLVSVAESSIHAEITREIESLGIPTTKLVCRDDFRRYDEFDGAIAHEYPYGYTIHEYNNIYGFYHPLCQRLTQPYLFDENGKGLRDVWYLEFTGAEPCIWNPSHPFDPRNSNVISMQGEYFLGIGLYFKNLWHFTYQTLDKILVMEKAGFKGRYLLVRAGFTVSLLSLLGIDIERVVWLEDFDPDAIYQFEKVFAAELPDIYDSKPSIDALLALGRIISENVGDDGGEYPSRLYVKRIGIRKMLGSDEVIEHYGFTTMVPEDYSFEEQIRFFKHADIIVSPHGAALTNTLYMKPGSVVIETFSNSWVVPVFANVICAKGIHYLPIAEKTNLTHAIVPENVSDYSIDNSILSNVIESAIKLANQELLS